MQFNHGASLWDCIQNQVAGRSFGYRNMFGKRRKAETLKKELFDLARKLKEQLLGESDSHYQEVLLPLLIFLEEKLERNNLAWEDLRHLSYAIFRTVTDDYDLEKSTLGQKFFDLKNKVDVLAKTIE